MGMGKRQLARGFGVPARANKFAHGTQPDAPGCGAPRRLKPAARRVIYSHCICETRYQLRPTVRTA